MSALIGHAQQLAPRVKQARAHREHGRADDLGDRDGMGLIAYPWLASAVTRNPLLIGLVSVALSLVLGVVLGGISIACLMVGGSRPEPLQDGHRTGE
jgi:hypothetical protein